MTKVPNLINIIKLTFTSLITASIIKGNQHVSQGEEVVCLLLVDMNPHAISASDLKLNVVYRVSEHFLFFYLVLSCSTKTIVELLENMYTVF